MLLSFIGILFVVDTHVVSNLTPFTNIFPLDSFFMPMFVFISGYFFNKERIADGKSYGSYLLSKVKKLLIPFLLWTGFYWLVTLILQATGQYHFEVMEFHFATILRNMFTYGYSFGYNDPSWFAILLFYVIVIYASLRFVLKKIWFEPVTLIIFVAIGAVCVHFAQTDFIVKNAYGTLLLKLGFFVQFFELGVFYKKYIDKYHNLLFSLIAIVSCIVINIILSAVFGDSMLFPRCSIMDSFNTDFLILPFITTITGTMFWLSICKLLSPVIGKVRVINFISENTFFIMTHHVGVRSMLFLIILGLRKAGVERFSDFNEKWYFSDPWYCYHTEPWVSILVFLLTITLVSLFCYALIKIKTVFISQIKKLKHSNNEVISQ